MNEPPSWAYLNGMNIRWGYVAIGGLVLLVGGKYVANTFFGPSDEDLIRTALTEAITASKEGRPGGVMDFIGDSFKINNTNIGGRQVADFVRNQKPDISIDYHKPQFGNDLARMTSTAKVKFGMLGFSQDIALKNITLDFKKESATDFLLLPVKKWRLVSVQVPVDALPPEAVQWAQ